MPETTLWGIEQAARMGLALAGTAVLDFRHVPGFPAGRRPGAGSAGAKSADRPACSSCSGLCQNVAGRFRRVLAWARRGIVDQHRWMTAEEFNETFALCHFLPGPNIVNLSFVFGSRFGGIAGGLAAFAGLIGPPMVIAIVLAALYARYGDIDALRRILAGVSCAAVGPSDRDRAAHDDAAYQEARPGRAVDPGCRVRRDRRAAVAAAGRAAGGYPAQPWHHIFRAPAGERMNSEPTRSGRSSGLSH